MIEHHYPARREFVTGTATAIATALLAVATPAHGHAAAKSPDALTTRFVFQARVLLGIPQEIGRVGEGYRRITPIAGGTFSGPDLRGKILPFGADWQILNPAGKVSLDARYTLVTDGNEMIYVSNQGWLLAPPAMVEDMIAGRPVDRAGLSRAGAGRMETGASRLAWMNGKIFLPKSRGGKGSEQDPLVIDFFVTAD